MLKITILILKSVIPGIILTWKDLYRLLKETTSKEIIANFNKRIMVRQDQAPTVSYRTLTPAFMDI